MLRRPDERNVTYLVTPQRRAGGPGTRPCCYALMCSVVVIAIATSGCIAAHMAVTGSSPDYRAWAPGGTRAQVEREVGPPIRSRPRPEGGRIDTYEFKERTRSGSVDKFGRLQWGPPHTWADVHAYLTVITGGAWNIIGIPIELARGETTRVTVTYGPDDRVVAFEYEPSEGATAEGSATTKPEPKMDGRK